MARHLSINYKIRVVGLSFRRSVEITQNPTRTPKRKSQALKSGSNQMADVRLAVRVRGKIGDKCCHEGILVLK